MVGAGGSRRISGNETLGRGHIVGRYNAGQEESILLTVRIHLVRNKRFPADPALRLATSRFCSWRLEKICLKDSPIWSFSALMRTLAVVQWEDFQVLFRQRGGESLNELSLETGRDGESGELHVLLQAWEDLRVLEIQRLSWWRRVGGVGRGSFGELLAPR